MTKSIDENAKKEMQKALISYKKDKNSVQEFYPCSQKLSTWLQEQAK